MGLFVQKFLIWIDSAKLLLLSAAKFLFAGMMRHFRQSVSFYSLLLAAVTIPLSFAAYTQFADVRLRCHVPSWISFEHAVFEVVPYLLIAGILGISWSFSMRAFKSTNSLFITLCILIVAFEYSLFLFAIVYYQNGLVSVPSINELFAINFFMNGAISSENLEILKEMTVNQEHAVQRSAPVVVVEPYSLSQMLQESQIADGDFFVRFTEDLQVETEIEGNPWNYLQFSLSVALPGVPSPSVAACPGSFQFQVAQIVWGFVLGLISIFFVARLNEKHSQSN